MLPYSQRDPRWADLPLGDGAYTIGQAGCLIASVSSLLLNWEVPIDPYRLDTWLKGNHGYVDGNLFAWKSIEAFGVKLIELGGAVDVALLKEAIAQEQGVILMVDANPITLGVEQHWMLGLGLSDNGELIAADPWPNPIQTCVVSAPLAYAIYERVNTRKVIVQHGIATEHQDKLRISGR